MKLEYQILYHFQNSEICILEIKIIGLNTNDKSKIYHWLLYDKVKNELFALCFENMGKLGKKEFRKFKDSYLEFDNEVALFVSGNKRFCLDRFIVETQLTPSLEKIIEKYISNLEINK